MQCPQCRAENPERARFCEDCGARLECRCPHCGEAATPGKKFCASCGRPLVTATATPRPAPSPHEYTPQHLAERILASRAALEGERKQVTVLFADLKGSMELLADRDPEEARQILDPVLERMMDAVHRYEGTVNQVMGDGIMALFGAPLAHEDHAVRACYAALRMQEAVKEYAEEAQRTRGVPVHIRVGLNSGEVVVRSIGSDLRMDYTAVGQTTHLAARMEQTALPGSILLAPETLHLTEGYFQVKALGAMAIKGLDAPIEVYELLGPGGARSRFQAAAMRGLTRFVGREAEIEVLRQTLDRAGAGHGQVVALVGEPGVGKSRLVWEFGHSHRAKGWLVLDAGSVSYGKATSYLPVIDLLKGYCGIEDRDDARRIREKLTGKLLTLDRALEPMLPALLALLDIPFDDPAWQVLDPPQRRKRTLDACKRLLLRESQEQPLLLVFEDLHWIDSETQALLDSLVETLPTARLLLLVNYRPEYEHGWHQKTYYRQLQLDPLPPASAEALLDALLGDHPELGALKRLLIARTEGNPFFLEESVRALVESGALAGEQGAYRLAQPVTATQVPATVQAVLAARIDRLAPEDKRLLQAASVIGKDVPYTLLQTIAELSEEALQQGLTRLQAAEFLYETSLFPDLEYTFKHALTHEVAYGSLLQERRSTLHAQICTAIEVVYGDRLTEHVERLAYHAVRGSLWEQAVAYSRKAGAKAVARSAHHEAAGYFEQALAAQEHLPESRARLETAIDLHFDLRNSLYLSGRTRAVHDCLRRAEMLAANLGDARRLARLYAYMSAYAWFVGDADQALEYGERALASVGPDGDFGLRLEAAYRVGQAHHLLGNYHQAITYFKSNVAVLQGDLVHERFGAAVLPALANRAWMLACLIELGHFTDGIAIGEEIAELAKTFDQPMFRAGMDHFLALLYIRWGDLDSAISLLESRLMPARMEGTTIFLPWLSSELGYAYALRKRFADGLALLMQAEELSRSLGQIHTLPVFVTHLSHAYLMAGRAMDADNAAVRALQLSRSHRARGNEAWALRLMGEIAAHADPPDIEQAESYYHQALALANELGMRPLAAHCHLGLGTLHRKVGRDDEARTELGTAAEMYRAMEMTFWLEKAEAALATPSG